jgi:hypothetical protein
MPTLENWFFRYNAWSYSKHRLFDLCKRSYYYRYIGTALKESKDFDIYKLKRLKDLNSKYALEGLLIHGMIENQIGQHSREIVIDGWRVPHIFNASRRWYNRRYLFIRLGCGMHAKKPGWTPDPDIVNRLV